MSQFSTIEWTESTWNPVRGCIKISPGCKNCYAETFAERFRGVPGHPYEQGFDPKLIPSKLAEPLSWPSPRRVFVNSMSDLFQDAVPDAYVDAVLEIMVATPWHTYQVLTKRAERLQHFLAARERLILEARHIWWGVSVEDRRYGLPRIDQLRAAPAGIRFLSVEPLLEDLGEVNLTSIDWVIVGGESGPRARPLQQSWVESLQQQCQLAGVAFFFKQWGGTRKAKTGRLLNGRTYDEMPPTSAAPILPVSVRRSKAAAFARHQELVALS